MTPRAFTAAILRWRRLRVQLAREAAAVARDSALADVATELRAARDTLDAAIDRAQVARTARRGRR